MRYRYPGMPLNWRDKTMASNQPVGFHHSLNHTLHNERILLYWNIQNDERNLHYSPRIHQCQHILASVAWNSFVQVQRTRWIKISLLKVYCLEFRYLKVFTYLTLSPCIPWLPVYPEGHAPQRNPGTVFWQDCSSKQGLATSHSSTSTQKVPFPVKPAGHGPQRKKGGQSRLKHSTP